MVNNPNPRTVVFLRTLSGVATILLSLQAVRPKLIYPVAPAEIKAPEAVTRILKQSCYPCHSNERRLSWFDEIVPAYWLVARDINKARGHINFSELGGRSQAEQRAVMFQAVNFIEKGVMPLRSYTRLHPEANVSKAQSDVLQAYLVPLALPATSARARAAAEYRDWINSSGKLTAVKPAPNGIAFPRDYKDWKLVDGTVRSDANTLRLILGNDVAMKAIAENKTNPWPDGTTFAKVGWYQQPDEHGVIRVGAFFKVGFMIKSSSRYRSTAGWGWGEWEGIQHDPYGKGPDFAAECVTCHTPQRKRDYIYTIPIQFVNGSKQVAAPSNRRAALTGDIGINPFLWDVITCAADPSESTISTLFGNDIAVRYSRNHAERIYPAGAVLSLVTWHQQDDSNWFGAKMPAETKSMEVVSVNVSGDSGVSYTYRRYEGSPLKGVTTSQGQTDERIEYIRSQRAAVMP